MYGHQDTGSGFLVIARDLILFQGSTREKWDDVLAVPHQEFLE